jgi:peptide chain release factor 1
MGKKMKNEENKKELLFSVTKKDFEVTWFSGTGAGGQYRNKHQNCCRIIHKESGSMGTGQSQRDRISNQKEAFNNCVNTLSFKLWLNKKIYEIENKDKESLDSIIDREMKKIKVEVMKNGEWEVEE